jgi:hypothetical protein
LLEAGPSQGGEAGFEDGGANTFVLIFGQDIKPHQLGPALGGVVALQKMAKADHLLAQLGYINQWPGVYRVGQIFGPVGSL